MPHVTAILNAISHGDPQASAELLPLVYGELRTLAAQKLAQERPGQTLQATGLVHEAYMRLVGNADETEWSNRGHFFAAAAEAMRRILIDNARRKGRLRHGGQMKRAELDSGLNIVDEPASELLALSEAIEQLEAEESEAAQVVKLRYFAALTIEETAAALNISVRKVNRHWAFARAWLYIRLN